MSESIQFALIMSAYGFLVGWCAKAGYARARLRREYNRGRNDAAYEIAMLQIDESEAQAVAERTSENVVEFKRRA